jgi:hypothetical protein
MSGRTSVKVVFPTVEKNLWFGEPISRRNELARGIQAEIKRKKGHHWRFSITTLDIQEGKV